MLHQLDSFLDRLDARPAAVDSIEGERLHRAVRARLLDETIPETRIDRYVVIERIGVGGMGVVYAAHDAQLDRAVAIKLVRGTAEAELDQQRLVREARALAMLSHPNVVAIYDVGMHRQRVFIAMELVRGATLRKYVAENALTWQEIVRCYAQAGEGLAAAHDAGIVHRDFKPENALVGAPEHGHIRVRVLDFGLAQGQGSIVTSSGDSSSFSSASLTATGKVVGTPAYMAPEQFLGGEADARTDQFSFCVALWEALHGERPFAGLQGTALREAMAEGRVTRPKHPERAPEWLRTVLQRGLAGNPAARWPSMRALLEACKGPRRSWRRWALALGIAIAGAIGIIAGAAFLDARARQACEDDARALAAWTPERASAIGQAFAATGLAHAVGTAERVDAVLDGWSDDWRQTHERACLAHEARTLDDTAWRLRNACLDDHRERLLALVDVLSEPDREIVNDSLRTAFELPSHRACEDDARLAANAAAVGVIDADTLAQLRRTLARASQLARARPEQSLVLADEAREAAMALGDRALQAEADLVIGAAETRRGEYASAETAYERAYFGAGTVGADEIALVASIELVDVVGEYLGRFDEGLAWNRHAEGLLVRIGDSGRWRAATLAEYVASVLRVKGDMAGARASYQRAIALRTEEAGPDHPAVGQAWASLGALLSERHLADAALPAAVEAERILVAAYGPDAFALSKLYAVRCGIASELGAIEEAAEHCAHALRIVETALGPDHPGVAVALNNLASMRAALDDPQTALAMFARALEIRRAKFEPDHPLVASSLSNLALMELNTFDFDNAAKHLDESLQIRRRILPPEHPDLAEGLLALSDIYLAKNDYRQMLPRCEEAQRITAHGSVDVIRLHGRALAACGFARVLLGDEKAGLAELEQAMETPWAQHPDPVVRCQLQYAMALAHHHLGSARTLVRQLARAAEAECLAGGDRGRQSMPELGELLQ